MSEDVGEALERAQTHFKNATREGLEVVRALLEAAQRASEGSDARASSLTGELKRSFDEWAASLDPERLTKIPRSLAEPLAKALDAEIGRWERLSKTDETARPVLRAFLGLRELLWELRTRTEQEPNASPDSAPENTSTQTGASRPSAAPRVQRFDIEE